MNAPRLQRAAAAAEFLDVSVARIYELARQGRIPCVHVGRQIRFDMDRLRAWAASGGSSGDQVDR